jgi:hypothetical protein
MMRDLAIVALALFIFCLGARAIIERHAPVVSLALSSN